MFPVAVFYSELQCVAVFSIVLQSVAVHVSSFLHVQGFLCIRGCFARQCSHSRSVLQCVAVCCSVAVFQCVAECCRVLQCVAVCCKLAVLQCVAVCCSVL